MNESIAAIEHYNPKTNIYLKVVGDGPNEHLEAVKICWLGRILMWLGWTSASMKKVANYIACNMDGLCKTWFEQAQKISKSQSSFGDLVSRVSRYDKKHPKYITGLTLHIVKTYAEWLSSINKPQTNPTTSAAVPVSKEPDAAPIVPAPILPGPISQSPQQDETEVQAPEHDSEPDSPISTNQPSQSNLTLPPIPLPVASLTQSTLAVVVPEPTLPPIAVVPDPTLAPMPSQVTQQMKPSTAPVTSQSVVVPPKLAVSPSQPALLSTKIAPRKIVPRKIAFVPMPKGSGIIRFKELRIAAWQYSEDTRLKRQNPDIINLGKKVVEDMKALKALLEEAALNPDEFKAIVKEIDYTYLKTFIQYGFKAFPHVNAKLEDLDVLGLYHNNGTNQVLIALMEQIPQDQLGNIVKAIGKIVPLDKVNALFNFASHVITHCQDEEVRKKVIEWIVRSELYRETVAASQVPVAKKQKILSGEYLKALLRKQKKFTDRDARLDEYMSKLVPSAGCRLDDPAFLKDLNFDEFYELGKALFRTKNFDVISKCLLIQQLVVGSAELAQRFYDFSIGAKTRFPTGFHQEMRELNPDIEKERIKYIVTDKKLSTKERHDAMVNFVKCSYAKGIETTGKESDDSGAFINEDEYQALMSGRQYVKPPKPTESILINKTACEELKEDEIILIGAAMFVSFPKEDWNKLYFINEFLESDPKKAVDRVYKVYEKAQEIDSKFDKFSIFHFYHSYKSNLALATKCVSKLWFTSKSDCEEYLKQTLFIWKMDTPLQFKM